MKRIQNAALCLSLLAGICAGCSEERFAPEQKYAEGKITLRVGTVARTKTSLAGSYNLNHVCQVYAILYEGTGDGASYVCHKDLDWNPRDSADYAEGVVQQKLYELQAPPALGSGKECTLLCVGLDDKSGETYSLTLDGDRKIPSFCAEGSTLADAKAILADGASMTEAELFAGWTAFTYQRKDTTAVEVELTRRVSGAYAYLKDIPVTISGKDVKYIQLVLGNLPNTQIALTRVERTVDNLMPADFGSVPASDESSKVLDKITLADIAVADGGTNLYDINSTYTESLGLSAQTLLLSAYLLPMAAGADGTLSIELLDESGALIKSFPAQWNNVSSTVGTVTCYPIYPNYVYHVGTRSADSDRPASLAGDRIELVVQPWTELNIKTEFPKVPLEATIDYDKNQSSYIYDCINTTDRITVMPSLLQKGWNLTLVAEDEAGNADLAASCNWIYFQKSDGSYTQRLSSSDFTDGASTAVDVTFRLCDYVVKRSYDLSTAEGQNAVNTDWRRARIVITTDDSSSPSYVSIRQYNAITVNVTYDGKAKDPCGFSRYNYGVVRDGNGAITEDGDGYQGKWGIQDKVYGLVYRDNTSRNYYDGYQAHENINSSITDPTSGYWGTTGDISSQPIIRYSWTESWVWNGIEREQSQNYWYLPSWYELAIFFRDIASQSAVNTNVKINHWYWSSTAKYNSSYNYTLKSYYSYGQMLGDDGKPVKKNDTNSFEARTWRTETGYARRARHFDDYDGTIK